ncbi:MAG TPA: hypothetical protein VFL42_12850, partial [Terriglobales bacterium]|nr:hypothetical protein [Terriglobales bacterium]
MRRALQVGFLVPAIVLALLAKPATGVPMERPSDKPVLSNELSSLAVPKLALAPKLADFEGMEPVSPLAKSMLKVSKFTQREPKDGAPATQRTEAYLGYTDKNLYVVFLA